MNNFIKLTLIILILIFIFYLINILLKKKEHMTMINTRLRDTLNKNGYDIDADKYIITKCENQKCKKYIYGSSNFNDFKSHAVAKNKEMSNKIFAKNNIPVPNHWIINRENMKFYMESYPLSFPCVLKPIDGMQGKDVNTFIKNKEQFLLILNNLLVNGKYDKVMMENQVYGDNYRIFMFNNQIMDVVKREQPYIVGNGKNTLQQLIEEKNRIQLKNKLYETSNLDWYYMKEQGYEKDSIPELNKNIFITNTINFHNGANPVRVNMELIPEKNKDMFIKAHKLIGLECSGIDYMSPDITVPYYENDGHIIEINDMVDTKIHIDADYGKEPNFLFNNIVKSLDKNEK